MPLKTKIDNQEEDLNYEELVLYTTEKTTVHDVKLDEDTTLKIKVKAVPDKKK